MKAPTKTTENRERKRHPALRVLGILLAVILCLGLAMYVIPLTETVGEKTLEGSADWMSRLDDRLYLNEIVLPGTHDSATQYVQLGFFSKCQALDIREQLEAGYRYLDIRLGIDGNRLKLVHGFVACKTGPLPWSGPLYLEQVLADCCGFLEAHPTETVVFVVKKETDAGSVAELEALLADQIAENPDRWLLTDTVPTLEEARGRIVLVRRYEDEAGLGAASGIPMLWEEQRGHGDVTQNGVRTVDNGYVLWVQDRFEYGDRDKWEAFTAAMAAPSEDWDVALNFLSTKGTLTYGHPWGHANTLNQKLLALPAGSLQGWIIVDFGSAPLARQIYAANFEN